jgi:hypothetical protein
VQLVEEFMAEYFKARTEQLQNEAERRQSFCQKFYAEGCNWDSRAGAVERSSKERIQSVSSSNEGTWVITEGTNPWPKLRYHLRRANDGWLITSVDWACLTCHGEVGAVHCVCMGTGWILNGEAAKSIRPRTDVLRSPNTWRFRR